MTASTTAYVGIGSNLGDRARNLADGARLLAERTGAATRLSPVYETAPLELVDQPAFLNAAVELFGALPEPHELLEICHGIEHELGRERTIAKGPRTIDLDLLLYGDRVIDDAGLTVPHPRLHERRFALEPLADLAPGVVHPRLGITIAELRNARAGDTGQRVTRI